MEVQTFILGDKTISYIISPDILISNVQDSLDLMANTPSDYIVLHEHNFEKDFFDLSTRTLGEVLQKFTNYHVKLAIIGNFERYPSKTLKDFMWESNKRKEYIFVKSLDEVKQTWKE